MMLVSWPIREGEKRTRVPGMWAGWWAGGARGAAAAEGTRVWGSGWREDLTVAAALAGRRGPEVVSSSGGLRIPLCLASRNPASHL